MQKTLECDNVFLMEDGFCTRCSTNHFRKKPLKPDKKHQPPRRLTEDQVRTKQFQREVRKILKFLNEHYDMKVKVKFINRNNAEANMAQNTIRMGYQCMDSAFTKGSVDYVKNTHIVRKWAPKLVFMREWGWKKHGGRTYRIAVKGMPGIRHVVLHEFAHFLDRERNRGHCHHDPPFQKCFSEILDLVPPEGIS